MYKRMRTIHISNFKNLLSSFKMRIEVELVIMTLVSMVVKAMLKSSFLSTMSSSLIVIRNSAVVVLFVVA